MQIRPAIAQGLSAGQGGVSGFKALAGRGVDGVVQRLEGALGAGGGDDVGAGGGEGEGALIADAARGPDDKGDAIIQGEVGSHRA